MLKCRIGISDWNILTTSIVPLLIIPTSDQVIHICKNYRNSNLIDISELLREEIIIRIDNEARYFIYITIIDIIKWAKLSLIQHHQVTLICVVLNLLLLEKSEAIDFKGFNHKIERYKLHMRLKNCVRKALYIYVVCCTVHVFDLLLVFHWINLSFVL